MALQAIAFTAKKRNTPLVIALAQGVVYYVHWPMHCAPGREVANRSQPACACVIFAIGTALSGALLHTHIPLFAAVHPLRYTEYREPLCLILRVM